MMSLMQFIKDIDARIPFSILGIFLLMSSSLTTVYLSNVDQVQTEYFISSIDESDFKLLLSQAQSDITSLMNIVGIKVLQDIGKNPVIVSNVPNYSAQELNMLRLKKSFISLFNQLLLINFKDNEYSNGRYAINVMIPSSHSVPIEQIDDVIINEINMTLIRPVHIPLIGPDLKETFSTYWKIEIPIYFEIYSHEKKEIIGGYKERISKVISSRFPLLYQITKDYNKSLQAFGPYWGFITAITNIYSLARGYKHYQSGKPYNVVNNHHLAPLCNGGLLFEQGLCFGSVDPHAFLSFLSESKTELFNKNKVNKIDLLNSCNQDTFTIPTEWFSIVPANIENNEEYENPINQNPKINITEIASVILYEYQMFEVIFKYLSTDSKFSVFLKNPSSKDLQQCIKNHISNDVILYDVKKTNPIVNQTTHDMINSLINRSYTSSFSTIVKRDPDPNIVLGNHEGFEIDNGTSNWKIQTKKLVDTQGKPDKGYISEYSIVHKEWYDITWTRAHYWGKKETIIMGNTTMVEWSVFLTEDTKIENNVSFSIQVKNISFCPFCHTKVYEVFYKNISLDDFNMEDTIETYKTKVFDVYIDQLFQKDDGNYLLEKVTGILKAGIYDEAIEGIEKVIEIMSTIKQNTSINASRFSNPISLLKHTAQDLLNQYRQLIPLMKNESYYLTKGYFMNVGSKAAYCTRAWFVDYVYDYLEEIFNQMSDEVTDSIDESLESYDFSQQDTVLSILDEKDSGSFFSESFSIPFGAQLTLKSIDLEPICSWNESIHLSVNQFPKYLSPFIEEKYEGKKEYFLAIRNTCVLGPTGIPILPITPATPWIVTLNIWLINIRGSYAEFILADGNDETIPNPLFGHDTQILMRKQKNIHDENGALIGKNTRISFAFDTACFSVVPSYGMMVGDSQGDLIEEDGFD